MHEVLEIRFDQQQAVSLSLLIASTLGFGSTLLFFPGFCSIRLTPWSVLHIETTLIEQMK